MTVVSAGCSISKSPQISGDPTTTPKQKASPKILETNTRDQTAKERFEKLKESLIKRGIPVPEVDWREPRTSESSSGPTQWKSDSTEETSVPGIILDKIKQNCEVYAVFSLDDDVVSAWKPDGSPFPEFEGYIRIKLENNKTPAYNASPSKKVRFIVLSSKRNNSKKGGEELGTIRYPNTSTELSGLINGDDFGDHLSLQTITIQATKNDIVASIPATYTIMEETDEVKLAVGSSFILKGVTFTISSIKPINSIVKTDDKYAIAYRVHTKVIIETSESIPCRPGARLKLKLSALNRRHLRILIDQKGNIANSDAISELLPPVLACANESNSNTKINKRLLMYSNVNPRTLAGVSFNTLDKYQVRITNIRLEGN